MNSKSLLIILSVVALVAVIVVGWGYLTYSGVANILGLNTLDEQAFSRVQDDYVLRPLDLDDSYYIDRNGERPLSNRSIILAMGELAGKSYITATDRVDGWYINLRRSDRTVIGPATITNTVEVFDTADGARLAISPEYFKAYQDNEEDFQFLDRSCGLGSECILYTSEEFDPVTRLTTVRYDIAFVYKNVLVWVSVTGLDVEVTQDDAVEAAGIVLEKLETFNS
jgi:hypothetical protein